MKKNHQTNDTVTLIYVQIFVFLLPCHFYTENNLVSLHLCIQDSKKIRLMLKTSLVAVHL